MAIRIDPGVKEALCMATQRKHRSIANMVEVVNRDYCDHSGISLGTAQ